MINRLIRVFEKKIVDFTCLAISLNQKIIPAEFALQ